METILLRAMHRCRRQRLLIRSASLALVLAGGACSQPASPSMAVALPLTRFRPESIGYLFFSGYAEPTTIVIRDRETWQSVWGRLYDRGSTVPPLPEIDFSHEIVLLAAAGSRPSSGYDVLITGASEADGVVTVEALIRSPAATCGTATVITEPVDLARMPGRNGTVRFHLTAGVNAC
jgi:hypothetical protein